MFDIGHQLLKNIVERDKLNVPPITIIVGNGEYITPNLGTTICVYNKGSPTNLQELLERYNYIYESYMHFYISIRRRVTAVNTTEFKTALRGFDDLIQDLEKMVEEEKTVTKIKNMQINEHNTF